VKIDSLILKEMWYDSKLQFGMTRNFKSIRQAPNSCALRLASRSHVDTRSEASRIAHRKYAKRSGSQWYSPTDTASSKWYSHTQLWIVATLQHATTHCNTLQHTATRYNTLQHATTHCNTLKHTATHCNIGHVLSAGIRTYQIRANVL